MRCVGAQILLVFWQIGLAFAAIASFHKESSDLQQIRHGHIFRVWGHLMHNAEQNVFFLSRRFSEAPGSP